MTFNASALQRDLQRARAAYRFPWYDLGKRVVDTSLALGVLILGAPLWFLIALAIRLTSAGPALYRGRVVGKGGREFTYYKFRTMRAGASSSGHQEFIRQFVYGSASAARGQRADGGQVFKYSGDKRITAIGHWLRKTSLDEIPQLLNVVKGDMSLVGPRPPVPYEYALYEEWMKERLTVLPGITGYYQVKARSAVPFAEMVRLDLEYIARRSLALDLWVILKTPTAMLLGE